MMGVWRHEMFEVKELSNFILELCVSLAFNIGGILCAVVHRSFHRSCIRLKMMMTRPVIHSSLRSL